MPIFQDSSDPLGLSEGYAPTEQNPADSEDARKLVSNIRKMYESSRDARAVYDRLWSLYQMYLKGDQLLYRDTLTGEYTVIPATKQKRLYSVNNQLRPTARSLVGKLCRVIPTFQVTPATAEQDEVYGARVADIFFEFFRRKEGLDIKYIDMQEYLTWCGTSVIQLYWDPSAGDELAFCSACNYSAKDLDLVDQPCPICTQFREETLGMQKEQAMMDGALAGQVGMETAPPPPDPLPEVQNMSLITEGDIRTVVRDPHEIFIDPTAKCVEDLRWVCIRTTTPLTEIRRRFPTSGMFVSAGAEANQTAFFNGNFDSSMTQDSLSDSAVLYEYHEKPSLNHPNGRVVWFSGDVLLQEAEGFYKKFKRLPFFWNRWTVNQGEFWGESFVHQAWHRQKELNAVETTIRETNELLAHPKFLVPIGSRVGVEEITALTGQIIPFLQAAGKPEPLAFPPLPQEVYERRNSLPVDIRQAGTVSDSESGIAPGDTAGRALAIVEAESNQQIGPTLVRNYAEWRELHKCILIMARDFYPEDKKFSIAGEEGLSIFSFDDLKLSDSTDLQLEIDDGLSKNAAVRLQQVIDLANLGIYTDKRTGQLDVSRLAKQARLKVPGIGIDTISSEYAASQAMLKKIEAGDLTAAQPSLIDDPMVFSEVMLGWLRGKGRRIPMSPTHEIVMRLWQYYTQWAVVGQMPTAGGAPDDTGAGASKPGQDSSAPGGTANNAGHMESGINEGGGSGRPVADAAAQTTQQADRGAEATAKTQQTREG